MYGTFRPQEKEACDVCGCAANALQPVRMRADAQGCKVLGSGCAKCNALETATREALAALGMEEPRRPCDGLYKDRRIRRHDHAGTGGGWQGALQRSGAEKGGGYGADDAGAGVDRSALAADQ